MSTTHSKPHTHLIVLLQQLLHTLVLVSVLVSGWSSQLALRPSHCGAVSAPAWKERGRVMKASSTCTEEFAPTHFTVNIAHPIISINSKHIRSHQPASPPSPACCLPLRKALPSSPSLLHHTFAERPLQWHAVAGP